MNPIAYLDTSVVLRAVLESGLTPGIDSAISNAKILITSRLSFVESSRALIRLRLDDALSEAQLSVAAREIDSIWARCVVWEITRGVCELAAQAAPLKALRSLDALHLATYLLARRRLGDVDLLTADHRLADAAGAPIS